MKKAYVDQTG